MSTGEAWKAMAVEILADAGLIAPERQEMFPSPGRVEYGQVPIDEAKLVRVIKIEPADDDRVQRLVTQAEDEAGVSRADSPSMSTIIRQALRLGLDQMERERTRK